MNFHTPVRVQASECLGSFPDCLQYVLKLHPNWAVWQSQAPTVWSLPVIMLSHSLPKWLKHDHWLDFVSARLLWDKLSSACKRVFRQSAASSSRSPRFFFKNNDRPLDLVRLRTKRWSLSVQTFLRYRPNLIESKFGTAFWDRRLVDKVEDLENLWEEVLTCHWSLRSWEE